MASGRTRIQDRQGRPAAAGTQAVTTRQARPQLALEVMLPDREVQRFATVDGTIQRLYQGTNPRRFSLGIRGNDFFSNRRQRGMRRDLQVLADTLLELQAPGLRGILLVQAARTHPQPDRPRHQQCETVAQLVDVHDR